MLDPSKIRTSIISGVDNSMGVLCMLIHFERLGFPVASRLRLETPIFSNINYNIDFDRKVGISYLASVVVGTLWDCGAAAAAEDAQICFEYQLQL